ncbi:transposase domain-containing protein [Mesorhizobium sp. M0644]|uniref:transposase domain-containing protein n=1 Tax=Mesorhizobium sp. M0644 TaxID=2956979 RepID=UPI003339B05D
MAERAIRGFTVGRRNLLFSGNFAAAERSAVVLSIIETCKLCGVDAEAYMADVTERIQNDWPASRWDESERVGVDGSQRHRNVPE